MDQSHEHSISEERKILAEGGQKALADLLAIHQEKLERIVAFRLAPFLRSRVDPADVIQEAYFEISRRINEFIDGSPVSFFQVLREPRASRGWIRLPIWVIKCWISSLSISANFLCDGENGR